MPSTLEPYSTEWLEEKRQKNQATIDQHRLEHSLRQTELLEQRKANEKAAADFKAKYPPKPPPEKSADDLRHLAGAQADRARWQSERVDTKAGTFISTITDLIYRPARRDTHKKAYNAANSEAYQNIDHAYMYHGSKYKHSVGSHLAPQTDYDSSYGKGRTLLFGTKRKFEASHYAKGHLAFAGKGTKLPISRKAGWLYTMDHSKDWESPLGTGFEGSEHITERAQKIAARERIIIPRHQVPVTRNELVAAAAVGIAVAAGTAGSAYYYRTQHNKRVRVKNPNWQHARRITH